jgi:hypothetical protein
LHELDHAAAVAYSPSWTTSFLRRSEFEVFRGVICTTLTDSVPNKATFASVVGYVCLSPAAGVSVRWAAGPES